MTDPVDILIAGGGLAGGLVALAMLERRPDVRVVVVEQGERFGGQHVWSFFDTDVDAEAKALLQPLISQHWPDHDIAFPKRARTIRIGYNSVRSSRLDDVLRARLAPSAYRLNSPIAEVSADHIVLAGGERIDAGLVLDARGPTAMDGLTLGWQKFVGHTYRFAEPHGCQRPMIMDGTVRQQDGYRFIYLLPFSPTELMIEDTYYSEGADLDEKVLGGELDRFATRYGTFEQVDAERGVLPVVIEGEIASLWETAAATPIGIRGGFFHPTTGYSLPDAARLALLLSAQREFTVAAIKQMLKRYAETLWGERRFFQLLNRMLFRAATPDERYRVLEHFYRLPEATIGRFYAADLTMGDKLRILTGTPPVPIGRALGAMRRQAA
ncbi:lycopene beta-cyclase CrtY [Sphingomonas piscis]|uniref:Lycopene beta-cyclase CrtY n=1 Tax=Sphingomonas piscis TaxID=2714943 RepID=A0A6G7YSE3_9SPHN|nr:lycopene beta-cyclase CrtY [Sphingomonas piscis]QIK79654.1 lycopene beta-cyclase CrtY [Sphingomonas piscis]